MKADRDTWPIEDKLEMEDGFEAEKSKIAELQDKLENLKEYSIGMEEMNSVLFWIVGRSWCFFVEEAF